MSALTATAAAVLSLLDALAVAVRSQVCRVGEIPRWSGCEARVLWVGFAACCMWLVAAPASAQLGSLISPGPLAQAHANLEGVANCAKCHEQRRKVTAPKCLACHAPIAQRIARKFGVHKDVTTDCVKCHVEHAGVDGELRPFDQKAFDHTGVGGFPLNGRHALGAQQCAACHKGRSFVDLKSDCVSCHADVHKPSLGTNCSTCHSTQAAFKGSAAATFDHSKSAFPLEGAHEKVTCASCHAGSVYKGIAFGSCTNCHKDQHRPSLGSTCTSCHTVDSWRTKTVNHGRTSFPLAGAHAKATCESCHKQPATKVALKPTSCTSCHDDAHQGEFKQDCSTCHTESSWKGGRFDHGTTKFALTGGHLDLACDKCHRPGVAAPAPVSASLPAWAAPRVAARSGSARAVDFRGLGTTCVTCHADLHQAELGTNCEACHSVDTFSLRTYTHRKPDPFFAGQHVPVTCDKCHQGVAPVRPVRTGNVPLAVRFTAAGRTCVSCHKDVHLGQLSATCESCHPVETAKFAVTLDHTRQTRFRLEGKHITTTCRECHTVETGQFPSGSGTAVRLRGVGTTCAACHKDVHLGQLGTACETCHAADTFHLPKFTHKARNVVALMTGAHARSACVDCHKSVSAKFPAGTGTAIQYTTGTACTSCHVDEHRGALGSNCGTCHRP